MRKPLMVALLVITLLLPLMVAAQTAASAKSGPPPVLAIYREEVKPGKSAAHAKVEATWVAAYKKANQKAYYLGTTALTGPLDAWFFYAFDNLEQAEKVTDAVIANKAVQGEIDHIAATDGELLTSANGVFAFYNKELSYRPDFNVGNYRYFMVDTIRLKYGHYPKFAEFWKAVNAAHEKAGMDEHMVVYNVGFGAPGGTVLVLQPYKSLKEVDDSGKIHGKGSKYYDTFGDEGRKTASEFGLNDVQSYRRDLLEFSPKMSFVGDDVVAANPSFWKPKTEAAKTEKTATPAAKKEPAETKKK